jgi:hypothetical protein
VSLGHHDIEGGMVLLENNFILAEPVVISHVFITCNCTIIMNEISGLNQIPRIPIKFYSNSKSKTEFHFSFEIR